MLPTSIPFALQPITKLVSLGGHVIVSSLRGQIARIAPDGTIVWGTSGYTFGTGNGTVVVPSAGEARVLAQ